MKIGFIKAFKIGFGLIPSYLFRFIKKLLTNLWFYAYISLIPMLIAFVGMNIIDAIAQNTSLAGTVFKILATAGQVIPLSFSLYMSECELAATDDNSAELCFAICAVVIAALWLN